MDLFSISQLAQFSGIKTHTIRMWEHRYKALNPDRSEGNTRYYDNIQLRRLLNIVSLMEFDYKVSELCRMPDKKLFQIVNQIQYNSTEKDSEEYFVSQLIAAGMSYDALEFDKTFLHCMLKFGMKGMYMKVIYPMFIRIGLLWSTDDLPSSCEHFISNLIRQKLFTAIDSLPSPKSDSDSWLLFLPENEFHEIGLLFAYFLIRESGRRVIYLGENVSFQSLIKTAKQTSSNHLLLFLVHREEPESIQKYLKELAQSFVGKKIHVSGSEKLLNNIAPKKNINFLYSPEDLIKLLN